MFIWSGFDYLGEPYPYTWPARSSFYGIVDLAGFPKDVYYLYQSEWTSTPVLHIFPHWNWNEGQMVDIWAYFNMADEAELYVNGISQGVRKKIGDIRHVMWRIPFHEGTLKAVSRRNGKIVLVKEIATAGAPSKILLSPDRMKIKSKEKQLSFVTVRVTDLQNHVVPTADNSLSFEISGAGTIAGIDNGNPLSHEMFKGSAKRAFNGLALAVIQSKEKTGKIVLTVKGENLKPASCTIVSY